MSESFTRNLVSEHCLQFNRALYQMIQAEVSQTLKSHTVLDFLRLLKENSRKSFIRGDLTSTSFITMNCIFITLKVNAKHWLTVNAATTSDNSCVI